MRLLVPTAAFALAALVIVPPQVEAQASSAHPLVGTWAMDLPVGMRIGPEGPEGVRGAGTLVVRQEGDSLIGMLDVAAPEGFPQLPPRRFAGAARSGTVVLERRSSATIQGPSGTENSVPAVTRLSLTVDGARVTGTQDSSVEGLMAMGASPQPVAGTRRNGS